MKRINQDNSDATNLPFGLALKNAALRLKFPGVAIVISDFHCSLNEVESGFRHLRSRNLDIVALQILGERDVSPLANDQFSELLDAETGQVFDLQFDNQRATQLKSLITKHTSQLSEYFRQRQIGFAPLSSDQDIIATFRKSQQALRVIR